MDFRPLPIGIEDFEEMISHGYFYADKTLLIKELMDRGSKVNLFTRPRRFGKTLNLSMIQYFFEKGRDSAPLFQRLNIMNAGEKYTKHMNQYPVINLTLKSASRLDFKSSLASLKNILLGEFRRHRYVLDSDKLENDLKANYQEFLYETASESKYSSSLKFLSECLMKYHEKKVIILIDEYDVPLENAFFKGFYDEMVDFIRSLLGDALKTNSSLHFAVLTGCLRISKESIFTGLNNLDIISILSEHYNEYFGFTEDELEGALIEYRLESKLEEVKKWYNGYLFGNTNVYNPWSVIYYLGDTSSNPDKMPSPYWSNTSSNHIIRSLIDKANANQRRELEQLITGGSITKQIHEDITYDEIDSSMDHLWNFLFFTGYLKKVSEEYRGRNLFLKLKIPNEEIAYVYENKIAEWTSDTINAKCHTVLYEGILTGNAEVFAEELNRYLGDSISYMDHYENFYHGFLVGLLTNIEDYEVRSNRETGRGRSDIYIMSALNKKTAAVMELKVSDTYQNLGKYCDSALEQIAMKKYDEELKNMGYQKVYRYGIAFHDKDCEVKLAADGI
ncbi:MAG: ATP-binding protein [Lachnoclostridium sp.]|jgi:hypothetical protein|nr:ATP-binding protein [Lachnoclostridium sp.]